MSTKTKIDYTVQVWQEGKQFVAHAMPLDVTSCGPTPERASQALFDYSQQPQNGGNLKRRILQLA